MTLKLRSVGASDRGLIRSGNQDAQHAGAWLVAVADGMGGMAAGDLASRMIVTSLAEMPARAGFDERLNAMRQCLHWLNRRLGEELCPCLCCAVLCPAGLGLCWPGLGWLSLPHARA